MAGGLVLLLTVAAACSDDSSAGDDSTQDDTTTTVVETVSDEPVPSAGCGGPATAELELEEGTLEVRDTERRYLLSSPAWEEGDDPLPLVVDIHGLAEGAEVHAGMSQLGPQGVEEGFATLFPHGTGEPVRWSVGTDPGENDDLAYMADLLDLVEEDLCLDLSRVYATGLSNGAMMTSVLACTMADRFAAVAPVAGIIMPEDCAPSRPVPVLTWHGTEDPILLFDGGVDTSALPFGDEGDGDGAGDDGGTATTTTVPPELEGEGYPATVADWAALNGCEDTFEDEEISDEVTWRRYHCPDQAPVEFVIVLGGGHTWPGSDFSAAIGDIVGHTTFDVDASVDMWEFFTRFRLDG